jgi:phosphatidylethanolamine/phosphatidyl-N-methylethanolamine N-methyltransferase
MRKDGATQCDAVQSLATPWLFGQEWLRAPLRVGAVAPSSARLADAMTQDLTATCGPVIELGPGTGVFTEALLRRGVPAAQVGVIEASESFAAALSLRFPQVAVIHDDAARIRHVTPFGLGAADLVICGLPLLSMPQAKVLRIVAGSVTVLKPDGELRLFTYGQRCPIPPAMLSRLGLVAQRQTFVPLNMPPASVYAVVRREQPA